MVNGLLTLNFKKVKRSKNNRKCILCTKCKVQGAFQDLIFLWAKLFYHYFFDKKNALEKRRKRRERRGGKKRKTNKKRERKRKTGLFQFSKSNLSKSTSLHIFNSLVITYTTLNFKSGQFCSLSFNAHTCFGQNAKRLSRLKTGIFHTQQSGGL